MGLFSRNSPRLPTTTYGYKPPPSATAHGWQCNNEDCDTGDRPAPRRWPFRCPSCGGFADPDFDEPWHEEAHGLRLQMLLDRESDNGAGYVYEAGIWAWRYGRALAAGDVPNSEQIRTQTSAWLAQTALAHPGFSTGSTHFAIVRHALDHGRSDKAAEELCSWYVSVDASDVENNSTASVNCRTLLHCQLKFLEDPQGARDPAAPQIAADARTLGSAIRRELSLDLEQRWARLK
jgi:hypothetical protein